MVCQWYIRPLSAKPVGGHFFPQPLDTELCLQNPGVWGRAPGINPFSTHEFCRRAQEIEQALRSEVNTLCYPKAALLAFCIALTTYNMLSTIKAAMRSAHRDPSLLFELSGYYLAEEISATYWGMTIAIESANWTRQFANLTVTEFAKCLLALAANADPNRFQKRKRGPKKPPLPRTGGLREKHVATKRLLDQRKSLTNSKC
jgi:hypothetical protein